MYGTLKFLISIDDIERCKDVNWCIFKNNLSEKHKHWQSYYYAMSTKNKKHPQSMLLHRFLTDCPKGLYVDHIDHNTLDNRRENLRICTMNENSSHRKKQQNNTSGVIGVCWSKKDNKWMAYIMVNRRFKNLGYYNDINQAADVRKQAELKYFGEFQPVYDDVS